MLGYVKPAKSELLVREWLRYRSVYCAVCKALGERFGQAQRMALSYDACFMALFLLSFVEDETEALRQPCIIHPLQKHLCAAPSAAIDFAADMSGLLGILRAADDRRDREWPKALSKELLFASAKARLQESYPGLYQGLQAELERFALFEATSAQRQLELDEEARTAAGYSGRMLELIFREGITRLKPPAFADERLLVISGLMARHLGQWVYLIDALDDWAADVKKGRYNPFAALKEADVAVAARRLLEAEEADIDRHAALLSYYQDARIVQNILCLGLGLERERVLAGRKAEKL